MCVSLTLESIYSSDNTEATTEELELMTVMDKADSLLNSGSFSDFDQLIGDTDDPRLLNAKELKINPGNGFVSNELRDILNNLLSLARKQTRCGMN